MEISPLIVQLGPTTPIATLRVRSESGGIWEVAPVTWSQAAGEDVYGPTSELIVTPPIFELKPGQEQLVRVGMLALGQEAAERAFRLFLREVPVRQGTGIGLRLRVQVGLPVFVAPVGPSSGEAELRFERTGDQLALVVANRGSTRIRLLGVDLDDGKGARLGQAALARYVLAGSTQLVPLEVEPSVGRATSRATLYLATSEGPEQRTLGVPRDDAR